MNRSTIRIIRGLVFVLLTLAMIGTASPALADKAAEARAAAERKAAEAEAEHKAAEAARKQAEAVDQKNKAAAEAAQREAAKNKAKAKAKRKQPPAAGAEPAKKGTQAQYVKQVFAKAGFTLHGEMPGFYASSRPARTKERGIVVAGTLVKSETSYSRGPKGFWRLTGNEIDIIAPPQVGPGAGKPWSKFYGMHPSGWVVASVWNSKAANRNSRAHAYLYNALDDRLTPIKVPGGQFISVQSVNAAGTVVGRCIVNNQLGPMVWSPKGGLNALDSPNAESTQPQFINDRDTIAGRVKINGVYRPRVWLAPDKPGGQRGVLTPNVPEGFDYIYTRGLTQDGVLLICAKDRMQGSSVHHYTAPFLWSKADGYTQIYQQAKTYTDPIAISDKGEVILRCWEGKYKSNVALDDAKHVLWFKDKAIDLPKYPGSRYTSYDYISGDGLITGIAVFSNDIAGTKYKVISFVLSRASEKGKDKGND